MTDAENGGHRVSAGESAANISEGSQKRERKRRKWDQPAESLASASIAVPGVIPVGGSMGSLPGLTLCGLASISNSFVANPIAGVSESIPLAVHAPSVKQLVSPAVPKPKMQDELVIAREIVINDAEPSLRYKLTKRQTQEEIQKCTGAVVITRGKYHPPNAPPDGEKPLFLHISAGAHLKETAERILAVDRAAALVEEMLKHTPTCNGIKLSQTLSACVFLGFDPDPSLDIASRIRGPNDQYINHIRNETGAIVMLKGRGSGNLQNTLNDEGQPLHIFLSSNNPKSLENAKCLAENLLDTISAECGATRLSSNKVYGAVPPPQELLAGVQTVANELKVNISSAFGLTSSTVGSVPVPPYPSVAVSGVTAVISQATVMQSGGFPTSGMSQSNVIGYPQPTLTGTRYTGYEGIYPQATPLQQVALALRQSSSPLISTVGPTTSTASNAPEPSVSSKSEEKRPPHKRKFQELPVGSKGPAKAPQTMQVPGSLKPSVATLDDGWRDISTIPAPKNLVKPASNGMPPPPLPPKTASSGMPPPPPKLMPPPPPPPKFSEPVSAQKVNEKLNAPNISRADRIPDTLVKLMEYGDEDDDPEDVGKETSRSNVSVGETRKPFWAV